MRAFIPALSTAALLACRPAPAPGPAPTAPDTPVVDTLVRHSTLTDTVGMHADLLIIERNLGPLDTNVRRHLQAVEVLYYGFTDTTWTTVDTNRLCSGVLLVHACVAEDVRAIFAGLRRQRFPIAKVVPINRYGLNADSTGWNDEASMAANNTSAFNYRGKAHVPETSKHAQGIAIDINPLLNPVLRSGPRGMVVEPAHAKYEPMRPGTLTRAHFLTLLQPLGWTWGGLWERPRDHQHVEKVRMCAQLRERIR
ncbi:MAG: M15 family metallopeptidase [Flavobacteriales bacterium]